MSEVVELPFDDRTLRDAYGCFPSGVAAVCAMDGENPIGLAVSSFTSISIDPPLVAISIAKSSSTWPRLVSAPEIGLSVLASGQDAICRSLASKDQDRFAGVPWRRTILGAVVIEGSSLMLASTVHDVFEGGDHNVALLSVVALIADPQITPLVFHGSRFRELTP